MGPGSTLSPSGFRGHQGWLQQLGSQGGPVTHSTVGKALVSSDLHLDGGQVALWQGLFCGMSPAFIYNRISRVPAPFQALSCTRCLLVSPTFLERGWPQARGRVRRLTHSPVLRRAPWHHRQPRLVPAGNKTSSPGPGPSEVPPTPTAHLGHSWEAGAVGSA